MAIDSRQVPCSTCGKLRYTYKHCKPCSNQYMKSRWRTHGRHVRAIGRESYFKKKYKISLLDYHLMLEQQGNRCAICSTDVPVPGHSHAYFNIDHCHKTGLVQGLLCTPCNTGLGAFRDSPKLMGKAALYVG